MMMCFLDPLAELGWQRKHETCTLPVLATGLHTKGLSLLS